MDLKGSRALVTGGGRGIGRAIALALADTGANVALAARSKSELQEVAAEIESVGCKALVIPADVTQPDEVKAMAELIEAEWGGLDILINNAGGATRRLVAEMTEREFEETIELNLTSVFRITRLFLPGMLARGRGHIVMIASTAGRRGTAGLSAYSAAKFGLNGFAQSLFYETRKQGVRVTTVFPSSVDTRFIRPATRTGTSERLIQPADIAAAVIAALRTDDRATIKEIEVWGTNPDA